MTDRPDPTRIVADVDVLAADLLVGGPARAAIDAVRRHSWLSILASDALIEETVAVITELTDAELATAWRDVFERERVAVSHPADDHPALGSAHTGGAAQVLSADPSLTSASVNLSLKARIDVSIRTPAAFLSVFDPATLYALDHDDPYPGPDRALPWESNGE